MIKFTEDSVIFDKVSLVLFSLFVLPFMLFVICKVSYNSGGLQGIIEAREGAVKAGLGKYELNHQGRPEFKWNEK